MALCACAGRMGGADGFERGGGVHADGWGGRAGTGTGPGPARRGVVESEAGEAADEFECGDVTGEAMDEAFFRREPHLRSRFSGVKLFSSTQSREQLSLRGLL